MGERREQGQQRRGQVSRERSEFTATLAAVIRGRRVSMEARPNQDEFAELAGISPSTYQNIESGARVADVSQLRRIAAAFGMTGAELWAEAEARMPR